MGSQVTARSTRSMLLYLYVFSLVFGGIFVGLSVFAGLFESEAELEADADADFDSDFDAELEADLDADVDADADVGFGADLDAGAEGMELEGLEASDFDLEGAGLDADIDGADVDGAGSGAQTGGGHAGDVEVREQSTFNPFTTVKFYTFFFAFFGLTGTIFEGLGLWGNSVAVLALSAGVGLASGVGMAWAMHVVGDSDTEGIRDEDYLGASGQVVLPLEGEGTGKIRVNVKGKTIDMRARLADEDSQTLQMHDTCFVIGVEDGLARVVDVETVENQLVKRS